MDDRHSKHNKKHTGDVQKHRGGIPMTTTVQKWGNSLAVRIPSPIADKAHIEQGTKVEFVIKDQEVTIKPKKKKPTLEELLAQITPENRHAEIDLGVEGNELI